MYVVLTGNPGTRKSHAMGFGKKLLRDSTAVRFAPQDTAGQRQGLVSAMVNDEQQDDIARITAAIDPNSLGGLSLGAIAELDNSAGGDANESHYGDRHSLVAMADEFSTFIGQGSDGLLDFLTSMWDGSDYDYKTLKSQTVLKDGLLGFIGCTTPTSLARVLPARSSGQGFLSRVILVYGANKYKSIPWPVAPQDSLIAAVKDHLHQVHTEFRGEFNPSPAGKNHLEELYHYTLDVSDARFTYYQERRFTHLLKLSMILAASGGRQVIEPHDAEEAHLILAATERGMPDALGEFGLSPLAQVKQGILEFCRGLTEPVTLGILRQVFHRDATIADITSCVNDLCNAGTLIRASTREGGDVFIAKRKRKVLDDDILGLLAEGGDK